MLPNNICSGTTTTYSAKWTILIQHYYKVLQNLLCKHKSYIVHRLLICPPDASSPPLWRHVQWVYRKSKNHILQSTVYSLSLTQNSHDVISHVKFYVNIWHVIHFYIRNFVFTYSSYCTTFRMWNWRFICRNEFHMWNDYFFCGIATVHQCEIICGIFLRVGSPSTCFIWLSNLISYACKFI
jgi:hypothetical protein